MIETGLSDGVVAFQRFCELTYKNNVQQDKKIKFNAFQNLEVGADYWKELIGESYKNWLTDSEFRDLTVSFQKRHLLAHCEGIVDDKYISKSGDSSYRLGQRIVVKESDVLRLVGLITKIVNEIRTKIGT